ncbi:hypothetical protein N321_13829, partial [Antrostomus carolinensis]
FLLLAQGRGCEECDSVCCMNSSEHSESIRVAINKLKENVKQL